MDDDKQVEQINSSDHVRRTSPRSYNFLIKLSGKLGTVATKSFVEVKQFLNHEITIQPAERFMRNMPRLRKNKDNNDSKPKSVIDLKKIVQQSHELLATANTVFPITLFPDTVFLDRTKVTIIRRNFFWSRDVMSIRIEDVLNVSASVGPLFGSLTVASRVMSTVDHFQINYFWRNDAIHMKHIIQGYVIAQHNKLDTADLSRDELIATLKELGHDTSN